MAMLRLFVHGLEQAEQYWTLILLSMTRVTAWLFSSILDVMPSENILSDNTLLFKHETNLTQGIYIQNDMDNCPQNPKMLLFRPKIQKKQCYFPQMPKKCHFRKQKYKLFSENATNFPGPKSWFHQPLMLNFIATYHFASLPVECPCRDTLGDIDTVHLQVITPVRLHTVWERSIPTRERIGHYNRT